MPQKIKKQKKYVPIKDKDRTITHVKDEKVTHIKVNADHMRDIIKKLKGVENNDRNENVRAIIHETIPVILSMILMLAKEGKYNFELDYASFKIESRDVIEALEMKFDQYGYTVCWIGDMDIIVNWDRPFNGYGSMVYYVSGEATECIYPCASSMKDIADKFHSDKYNPIIVKKIVDCQLQIIYKHVFEAVLKQEYEYEYEYDDWGIESEQIKKALTTQLREDGYTINRLKESLCINWKEKSN